MRSFPVMGPPNWLRKQPLHAQPIGYYGKRLLSRWKVKKQATILNLGLSLGEIYQFTILSLLTAIGIILSFRYLYKVVLSFSFNITQPFCAYSFLFNNPSSIESLLFFQHQKLNLEKSRKTI